MLPTDIFDTSEITNFKVRYHCKKQPIKRPMTEADLKHHRFTVAKNEATKRSNPNNIFLTDDELNFLTNEVLHDTY